MPKFINTVNYSFLTEFKILLQNFLVEKKKKFWTIFYINIEKYRIIIKNHNHPCPEGTGHSFLVDVTANMLNLLIFCF